MELEAGGEARPGLDGPGGAEKRAAADAAARTLRNLTSTPELAATVAAARTERAARLRAAAEAEAAAARVLTPQRAAGLAASLALMLLGNVFLGVMVAIGAAASAAPTATAAARARGREAARAARSAVSSVTRERLWAAALSLYATLRPGAKAAAPAGKERAGKRDKRGAPPAAEVTGRGGRVLRPTPAARR